VGNGFSYTETVAEEERMDTLGRPAQDNFQRVLGTGSVTLFSDESESYVPRVNDVFNFNDAAISGTDFSGDVANAAVTLDDALILTAVKAGRYGNDISIALVDPGVNDAALSLAFDSTKLLITVNLATDGGGLITSDYADITALLVASAYVSKQVTPSYAGGETGTSVAIAVAETNLANGAGDQAIITSVTDAADGALDVRGYSINFKELTSPVANLHA